ncbi:MAG: hypothetical protein K1W38_22245, partial [Lachnospiraceae bacterium]
SNNQKLCLILAPVKLANSSVAFLMRLHKKCFYFLKVLFSEYSIIKISLLEFSGLHYCLFVKVLFIISVSSGCPRYRAEKMGFEPMRRY